MNRLLFLFVALFLYQNCSGQVEYLLKIDPITGTLTKIDVIPNVNWITTFPRTTTFDHFNQRYSFRGGDAAFNWSLVTVDAITGALVYSPPYPQLTDPDDNVIETQYDGTNGNLYAVHWDDSAQTEYFVSVDPATGVHTIIAPLPGVQYIANSTFDHVNRNYILDAIDNIGDRRIYTIDVVTGAILTNPVFAPFQAMNDNISELQYDSGAGIAYGLYYHSNPGQFSFCSVDVSTGNYTIISSLPVTTIYGFPGYVTYDPNNGRYFFRAFSDLKFYTIDVTDGSIIAAIDLPTFCDSDDNIIETQYDNTGNEMYAIHWDSDTLSVTVNQSGPLSCGQFGSASVTVSSPGSYQYEWSTGATTSGITGLSPGIYTVSISSTAGCIDHFQTVEIIGSSTISLNMSNTPALCSSGLGGSATANPAGGAPPYTYLWSNNATTQTISNLAPGTYSVTVTDGGGCSQISTVNVGVNGNLIVSLNSTTTCGSSNATASATTSQGVGPFTYLWTTTPPQTTATITGLSAGLYQCVITDANGCTGTGTVVIQSSSSPLVVVNTNLVNCSTGLGGNATAFVNNSPPPFTYVWSNNQTTQSINNVPPGTYFVTVTDGNGCEGTSSGVIGSFGSLSAQTSTTNADCGVSNGTATVTTSQGTGPYTYTWNTTPPQTTSTAIGLSQGSYDYTITDAGGCSATGTVTVIGGGAPPTVTFSSSPATCSTGQGGSATANPTGGTPPFTYLWSNNLTTQTINNLIPGMYSVTITDDVGCSVIDQVTITISGTLTAQTSSTDASCGANNGTATATTNQGGSPYTYLWNTTPPQTTSTANGLAAGNYAYTITDINGCMAVGSVTVGATGSLGLSVTGNDGDCSANDASASAIVTNGTPPFTYLWSNNATMQTIGGLATGTYTVTVTDGNGCIGVQSVSVVSTANGPVLSATHNNITCPGSNDGSIDITVNSGTPPFQYDWGGGVTTEDRLGLPPGVYTVLVTDANGCLAATTVVVSEPMPMVLTPFSTSSNGTDGTAAVNINGGVPPFTYQWNDGQTSQVATGLAPGTYSVIVIDANGCTTQGTVVVNMNTNTETIDGLELFVVYPVPNNGVFTVEAEFGKAERVGLRVLDVLGRVLFERAAAGRSVLIPVDLSEVVVGVYVVELRTEMGRVVKEVLVID